MDQPSVADAVTQEFEELAEQFTHRLRNGERPQIEDYVLEHPELASMIERLFPILEVMESSGSLPQDLSSIESFESALNRFAESPVGKQLGEFTIIREIGRGGMGIVFLAHQKSLDRQVALKLVSSSAQFDERKRLRFQEEARASAMLHHTNIVPVFDIGRHEDFSFIVMQYIDAFSISQLLSASKASNSDEPARLTTTHPTLAASTDEGGSSDFDAKPTFPRPVPLPSSTRPLLSDDILERTDWAIHVGIQIANALDHAHSKGILHRDIKPSNLLVDDAGNAWVSDFGLAKTVNSPELTQTGEIVGTLRYMSPEQMNGQPDRRSDIFGLGLTLYEIVAGKPAYDASTREQLVQQIVRAAPKSLRKAAPQAPRDIATVIEKAIAAEPDRRYQSAAELAKDLVRIQNGEPIHARRVSLLERAWKWCRRNSLVATLFTCLTLLFAIGSIGIAYHLNTVQDANAELKRQIEIANGALAESERQSRLSLDTLGDVIADFAIVFNDTDASRIESKAKRRMVNRVLSGLKHVSGELQNRNEYGKTLIWAHLDIADLYLRIGGEGYSNAEHLAVAEYQVAYQKCQQWVKNRPDSVAAQEVLSETAHDMARMDFYQGKFESALERAKFSSEHYAKVVAQNESKLNWAKLRKALIDAGITDQEIVDFVDDNISKEESFKFKDRVARISNVTADDLHKIRTDTRDRRSLFNRYMLISLIYFRSFQLEEAVEWYNKSDQLYERSKQVNPATNASPQIRMKQQLDDQRMICQNLPAVRDDWKHALKFGKKGPRLLYDCAAWQAFEGQHIDAAKTLAFINTLDSLAPEDHYSNACGYGRCIKALLNDRSVDEISNEEHQQYVEYQKQAMVCLNLANDGGMFKRSRDRGLLGRDHDLDPLRGSPEFEAFFLAVTKPADN